MEISYFCEKCEKEHSEKYNAHKRYAREDLASLRKLNEEVTLEKLQKQLDMLETMVESLIIGTDTLPKDVDIIRKTLRSWATYMEQHVRGWRKTAEWSQWAWNDIIAKDEESVIKDEET